MKRRERQLVFLSGAVLACAALFASAQYRDPDTWAHRDTWQHPAEVMDALHVAAGSDVADVGAGEGYFTDRMARRVGGNGKVYAVDIDPGALRNLRELKSREHLTQVEVVGGAEDDPHLPATSLDAVLIVNAYHEFRQHDAMLHAIVRALKPGGYLGIIEKADRPGEPRESYERRHHLPEQFVREDLARDGFTQVEKRPDFRPNGGREGEVWYFLVARPAGK
jgi:predicted methyltransferase